MGKPGFPIPLREGQARPREGLGGQSPPRRTLLSPCGCGPEARAPGPRPTGGSGGAQPSQEQPLFILFVCGAAAWTAEVTIVRRVQLPSQPPPAGGRRRVPASSGGGSGKRLSPCPRSRGAGVPPALPGHVHWAVWAMRMTISRDHGGTRFPHPTRGRVWEGCGPPRNNLFSSCSCAAQPHRRLR